MKLFSRLKDHGYCAFCRSPRKVYSKKHIDLTNVVAAALFAGTVTMALWGQLDPQGLMLFIALVGGGEMMVYLRWRTSIVCRMCGFDPVVYKRSPAEASRKVRDFFERQIENPRFHLSRSPLLELQRKRRAMERKRHEMQSHLVRSRAPMIDPKSP